MQRNKYPFVVIGAESVGKTSIIMKYCNNVFRDVYLPTMCSELYTKTITDNERHIDVELQIHDIGGQDQYKMDKEMYIKQAYAVIIVFSVVDIVSFDALESLVNDVHEFGNGNPVIMIVANKIDLRDDHHDHHDAITTDQLENEARYLAADIYLETSAKEGWNINEIFSMAIEECIGRESFSVPRFSQY